MPDVDSFKLAIDLHRSGRLDEAERLYRQALSSRSNDPYVLVHLAMLVQSRGRLGEAIDLQRSAVALRPDFVAAWCNLGNMLLAAGNAQEAADAQRTALALQPELVEAWANMSSALRALGRGQEALSAALEACRRQPEFVQGQYQRAAALRKLGQYREAAEVYELVLQLKPDLFEAWYDLGAALLEAGRIEEAQVATARAIALCPNSPEAACAMGSVLCSLGHWDAAHEQFERALKLRPQLSEAQIGLAAVLRGQGRLVEAVEKYHQCIEARPEAVEARQGLALALFDEGRFNQSLEVFEDLATRNPSNLLIQYALGCELLLRENWSRGWPLYEKRLQVPHYAPSVPGSFPAWDGGDLKGRRILLHHEQGLGDTIQFVRYVAMPVFRDARVVLRCQPSLFPLLQGQFNVECLVADGEALPPGIDCHITLPSLPAIFNSDRRTIPSAIPYITPPPALIELWHQKLGPRRAPLRVGITWAGNPAHLRDRRRSMSAQPLFRMAAGFVDEVEWHSLQKLQGISAPDPREADLDLIDFTSELTDLAQTAALMSQLDLVLTVDTSVAHLAGAIGKPTCLMLPFMPDWRWGLQREDSPWYSTLRLFRQRRPGDWYTVLTQVSESLHMRLRSL